MELTLETFEFSIKKHIEQGKVFTEEEDFVSAEKEFNQALAYINMHPQWLTNLAAAVRFNLGSLLYELGRFQEAIEQYSEECKIYRELINVYGEVINDDIFGCQIDLIYALKNEALALHKFGRGMDAVDLFRHALEYANGLVVKNNNQLLEGKACLLGEFGSALRLNHSEESIVILRQAIEAYKLIENEIDSNVNLEKVSNIRINLINALAATGREEDAYKESRVLHSENQILANTSSPLSYKRRTFVIGQTLMNSGGVSAALDKFQTCLGSGNAELDIAVHANLAKIFSTRGDDGAYIDQCEAALAISASQRAAGLLQFRATEAKLHGDLSHALMTYGDAELAMAHCYAGMKIYAELLQEGQLEYADDLIVAINRLSDLALARLKIGPHHELKQTFMSRLLGRPPTFHPDVLKARTYLTEALHRLIPFPTIYGDVKRHHILLETLDTLQQCWQASSDLHACFPTLQEEIINACSAWLEQAAELLAYGNPSYLNEQYEDSLKPMLRTVLGIFLAANRADKVAIWHLRSQGLRTQRRMLTNIAVNDPELVRLNQLYKDVEDLDQEIAGQYLAQDGAESATPTSLDEFLLRRVATNPSDGIDLKSQAEKQRKLSIKLAKREQLWEKELEPLQRAIERSGKLSIPKQLTLEMICGALAGLHSRRSNSSLMPDGAKLNAAVALLLLISTDDKSLTVVCVQTTGTTGLKTTNFKAVLHQVPLSMSEKTLCACLDRLTQEIANNGRSVRGGSGSAADQTDAAKPMPKAMTEAELATLRSDWLSSTDVLRPLLADLRTQGVTEVHVVPGGDLHLAPWAANLDGPGTGLRVRQFPTTASWWRVMKEDASEPVAASRWASLAFDATNTNKPELKWVGVEARALEQILADAQEGVTLPPVCPLDTEKPYWPPTEQISEPAVNGLVGMGHGGAQEGNWAMAGLFTGTEPASPGSKERDRYFTGLNLSGIKEVRHLVMSCCVLGRLQDSQGEPIGLTALAFAFKARMAVGAMVPIPDFEGALFSMALHFAWAAAEKTALAQRQAVDWSAVFHATRREVMAGRWPLGFGEWLRVNLFTLATTLNDHLDARRSRHLDEVAPGYDVEAWIETLGEEPTSEIRNVASMFTCLG